MINYGGIPEEFRQPDNSPVVVIPVPYDGTSTWVKGADKGPDAILEASANMELFDIETSSEVYQKGIYTAPYITEKRSPELLSEAVYQEVKKYLKEDKLTVLLGGEHSVSIGAIKAYSEKYPNLTVLQLDAHSDMRPEYEGSTHNHACVMARAKEFANTVQVGIRSMDSIEIPNLDLSKVFFAEEIVGHRSWMNEIVHHLSDDVYITIDLDVFDPSIMPSTGTPEPGGLSWYTVLDLLKRVNAAANIVGFDIVELCPNPDNKAPDFLASKLIYKILSYKYSL